MFISKSFKELFSLTTFFRKADAKVRLIFELPKLFRSFFEKSFLSGSSSLIFVSVFQLYRRFSLESGCKSTALKHICQILQPLFYKLFASFPLSRWFSKQGEEHNFQGLFRGRRNYTLLYIIGKNKTRKSSSGTSNLLYIRLISMKFPDEVPFSDSR